jgi:DNA modification methylase
VSLRYEADDLRLYLGDVREELAGLDDGSVDCVVTSPPYWALRDYGFAGQLGLEPTPAAYVANMVDVFRQVRRVLAPHGTAWVNIGDSFNNRNVSRQSSHQGGLGFESEDLSKSWAELAEEGRARLAIDDGELKEKDLVGIPWALALALRAGFSRCQECGLELRTDLWPRWDGERVCLDCLRDGVSSTRIEVSERGWWLRAAICWAKPNGMPESMADRPTRTHELVFMLAKNERYYFDQDAVREPHAYDGRKVMSIQAGQDSIQHRDGDRWPNPDGRNVRDVWEITPTQEDLELAYGVWRISPKPFKGAHFAVMPEELARRCIIAGAPERVCRICGTPRRRIVEAESVSTQPGHGKAGEDQWSRNDLGNGRAGMFVSFRRELGWTLCGCLEDGTEFFERDALELIETPLGEGTGRTGIDPTPETGRRGLGRERADDAGVRSITRYEQRRYAEQLKASPFRDEMADHAGFETFAHYIRTDRAGARAVPPGMLNLWIGNGWLERVDPPDVEAADWPGKWRPGVVLDPFVGSGTVPKVARDHGRHAVGIDGKEDYVRLAIQRNAQLTIFTEEVA